MQEVVPLYGGCSRRLELCVKRAFHFPLVEGGEDMTSAAIQKELRETLLEFVKRASEEKCNRHRGESSTGGCEGAERDGYLTSK